MADTAAKTVDPTHDGDHRVIWLAPICEGNNRSWCQDDAWERHCDCGGKHQPVKYVRAKNQDRG